MALIKAKQIRKEYLLGRIVVKALNGVDLEIEDSRFVCITGPSGSGKSTFINLIGLLDSPSSGYLEIYGIPVKDFSQKRKALYRRKEIGFIFQAFNLLPSLTVFENVEYPLVILGVKRRDRIALVRTLLEAVGIAEYERHFPDDLSGGQRQRVAIARALVKSPKIVLADEPTANLDSITGKQILDLMGKLNKEAKTTFLVSSHDNTVLDYADRHISMVDGRIVSDIQC